MAGMHSRLRPLNILDAEWRRSVWKRWLLSHLAGFEPVEPPAPPPPEVLRQEAVKPPEPKIAAVEAAPAAAPPPSLFPPPRESDPRRGEVRARFDALFDRLLSLEDTLDALGKRFALRAVHERRHDQRVQERLESTTETLERQTLALESVVATVERVEQRVERLERWLRADSASHEAAEARDSRDSRLAPPLTMRDEFDELEHSFSRESVSPSRVPPPDSEVWDEPLSASSIRGNLAEMSLPTVLAMLELERRTGVLKVCADDGSIISATIRDGQIVGARQRDLDAEPIEALREALRFPNGHFWFRQAGVEVASGPPRSVGSVLLEATRQNDEALRTA